MAWPSAVGVFSWPDCGDRDLILGQYEPHRINMEDDYALSVHGEGTRTRYVEIEVRNDLIVAEQDRKRITGVLVRVFHDASRTLDE